MRTRRSLLWTGLTAASALLAVAAAVVWAASLLVAVRLDYAVIDRSADPREVATTASLATVPHQLQLGLTRVRLDRTGSLVTLDSYIPRGLSWRRSATAAVAVDDPWLPAVVRPDPVDTGFGQRSTVTVRLPLWLVVLAGGVLPVVRVRRWFARRRWVATACRRCGYDLQASPVGRCPECGAVAADVSRRRPPASA